MENLVSQGNNKKQFKTIVIEKFSNVIHKYCLVSGPTEPHCSDKAAWSCTMRCAVRLDSFNARDLLTQYDITVNGDEDGDDDKYNPKEILHIPHGLSESRSTLHMH